MKGWVGQIGWPVADSLPTTVVNHQLQVERRTGKVCLPETDVLPLCHATNPLLHNFIYLQQNSLSAVLVSMTDISSMSNTETTHTDLEDFLSILLCVDVCIIVSTRFNKHSQECFSNSCFTTHGWRHTSGWRTIYTAVTTPAHNSDLRYPQCCACYKLDHYHYYYHYQSLLLACFLPINGPCLLTLLHSYL